MKTRPAVLITGASEGIGRAFAIHLGAAGRTVVLLARNHEALLETANDAGNDAHVLAVDLEHPGAAGAVEDFFAKHGLHAETLINNAGIGFGGRFDDQNADDIEKILAVNVAALVRLSHKFLPSMLERRQGGILNVASLAGYMPGPHQALYFASKAFVLSFSQAIGDECVGKGVHVMAAAPGPIETKIHSAMKARWSFYKRLFPSYTPEHVVPLMWNAFARGHRVYVPGLVSNLAVAAARFVPNDVLVPLVGILVRPRFRNGRAST
jgi:short-subunit dehydrogenase